ncbi:MAG: hypothetical protein AAB074_04870 [Planctomycetota bacterium]
MFRRFYIALPFALAACTSAPQPPAAAADPRLQIKILYVLEDGGVFRYDELASAPELRNFREVRTESDAAFTRYSFTLHAEGPDHWWTSL